METVPAWRKLWQDVVRVDRSQVVFWTALRNAGRVFIPLAIGAAAGQLLFGLTADTGALQVAFADRPGPYRLRAGRMLLACLAGALSVFAGAATGTVDWLAVVLPAIWGLAGGLLVALGPAATQIGLTGIIVLLVYGAHPLPPALAVGQALLFLAGGLLQTLLTVVMAGYLHPDQVDSPRAHAARLAARLARSNAEASVDRLRTEAATSPRDLDFATGLLANSHRFAYAVMAVEAELYHQPEAPRPTALQTFVADVDTTLAAIAVALRDSGELPAGLPDLRADQSTLVATARTQAESGYQMAVLTAQTERITNSLNTILHLLRYPATEAASKEAPAPAQPAPQPQGRPG